MYIKRKTLALPYIIFLILFTLLPLAVLLYYACTDESGRFTLAHFGYFFSDRNTLGTLLYSVIIAVLVTLLCLLLAYPVALILSSLKLKTQTALLYVFIMPMWINFTLRITALKEILDVLEGNLALHPLLNTVLGMTYDFLPFMILPIYTTISQIDESLREAASDLGADSKQTFLKVILPLSVPGIISGVTMVFLPAMTNYVVLDMLYNSTYIMGSLIGSYFSAYDWHGGATISVVLLLLIVLLTLITNHFGDEGSEERGTLL